MSDENELNELISELDSHIKASKKKPQEKTEQKAKVSKELYKSEEKPESKKVKVVRGEQKQVEEQEKKPKEAHKSYTFLFGLFFFELLLLKIALSYFKQSSSYGMELATTFALLFLLGTWLCSREKILDVDFVVREKSRKPLFVLSFVALAGMILDMYVLFSGAISGATTFALVLLWFLLFWLLLFSSVVAIMEWTQMKKVFLHLNKALKASLIISIIGAIVFPFFTSMGFLLKNIVGKTVFVFMRPFVNVSFNTLPSGDYLIGLREASLAITSTFGGGDGLGIFFFLFLIFLVALWRTIHKEKALFVFIWGMLGAFIIHIVRVILTLVVAGITQVNPDVGVLYTGLSWVIYPAYVLVFELVIAEFVRK